MGNGQGKKLNKENEIYSTVLIHIKVLMKNCIIWEKIYNREASLEQIYNDFIIENNYEKQFSISWYYNKIKINIDSTKLNKFMQENNILNFST